MTRQILMSEINGQTDEFRRAVEDHINKLLEFNKKTGVPRPVAHHLVEAAVKRTAYPIKARKPDAYTPDYVIVDDQAKPESIPEPSFEQKVFFLHQQITDMENAAKFKLLPQKKIRYTSLRMAEINSKDPKKRTTEEKKFLTAYEKIQTSWRKIELQAAQAEHDLEDITPSTISKWQPPKFK